MNAGGMYRGIILCNIDVTKSEKGSDIRYLRRKNGNLLLLFYFCFVSVIFWHQRDLTLVPKYCPLVPKYCFFPTWIINWHQRWIIWHQRWIFSHHVVLLAPCIVCSRIFSFFFVNRKSILVHSWIFWHQRDLTLVPKYYPKITQPKSINYRCALTQGKLHERK